MIRKAKSLNSRMIEPTTVTIHSVLSMRRAGMSWLLLGSVLGIVCRGFNGADSRIVVIEALLVTQSDIV